MITAFLVGFIAHIFNPLILKFENTPVQIRLMMRYVIGGVAILISNHKMTLDDEGAEVAKEATNRLSNVMVFVGVGVLLGHFLEEMYYTFKK